MRKEVVATFIFYHGDGSGISCSRFRLHRSRAAGRSAAERRSAAGKAAHAPRRKYGKQRE